MEQELTTFLINNGFAVFVAGFILIRTENTIKKNTEAINALVLEIKKEKNN